MGVVTFYSIRDLRDSVPVHELSTCCYDMQNIQANHVLLVMFKAKAI